MFLNWSNTTDHGPTFGLLNNLHTGSPSLFPLKDSPASKDKVIKLTIKVKVKISYQALFTASNATWARSLSSGFLSG